MVMQEQARRLREPLHWGRRERTIIGIVLAVVVAAAIGLGAYALTSGAPARADCVDLEFPSTLGAAEVKGCGPQAQRICASGAYKGIRREMQAACEHAGFTYRSPE
ncbi:MAG: hypothetical protein JWM60_3003 [Solirubrobacterales bacterium]|jgi:hypothetical protein|nr:hypothetical protein [Solirubrobacterales bacterium]